MIVFAAFTPHSPLLLPPIGKDARERMRQTITAMEGLGDELYASKPDTIVCISAHATQHDAAFSANMHDHYHVDMREFGDLTTTREFSSNPSLLDAIQRSVRHAGIPFTLDSDARLDYGSHHRSLPSKLSPFHTADWVRRSILHSVVRSRIFW